MKARLKETIDSRWLTFILRLALGGIFIAASISKFQLHTDFINTVVSYGILPDSLAWFYGFILPWAELFVGCSLILGIFPGFAAILSILMVISFIVANIYSMFRPVIDICGCFGTLISLSHPVSLMLDAIMLLMALQILLHEVEAEFLSVGAWLQKLTLKLGKRGTFTFEKASKVAVVALAMIVVVSAIWSAQGSSAISTPSAPWPENTGIKSWLNPNITNTPAPDNTGSPNPADADVNSTPEPNNIEVAEPSPSILELDSALASGNTAFLFLYKGCQCDYEKQFEIIEGLEQEYGDRIAFLTIDYEKEPQVAEEFKINNSPTMLLITGKEDNGEYIVYERFVGDIIIELLKNSFDHALLKGKSVLDIQVNEALASGKLAFLLLYKGCKCGIANKIQMLSELEPEYGDRIAFIIFSYDNEPQAAAEFNVESSPSMLLIRGKNDEGEYIIYQRFTPDLEKKELQGYLDKALEK